MKKTSPFILLLLLTATPWLHAQGQDTGNQHKDLRYVDGHALTIIGKYHDEKTYARFPARYKSTLRPEVWDLGQNAAGVGIRFRTNSSLINVRWTLQDTTLGFPHMPPTGVSGVDLYGYTNGGWQYIKTGFPRNIANEATLLEKVDGAAREYLLNLPLYNGVVKLEIGIEPHATISRPEEPFLISGKPVVYYGTSIAQGGCASRPGMAYTSILSRRLNRPFINLGFSGNGTAELSVGEAMCEVDAALYVVDCNPNTEVELIYERTVELVEMLKSRRPAIPVLLVERDYYKEATFAPKDRRATQLKKNAELKRAFDELGKRGIKGLHYLPGNGLLGQDHEGTVDADHPNDIGMARFAEALLPVIKKLL